MFGCLTNTTPQNTTTKNQPQTHDTIQNLKFGMYRLAVRFQNQTDETITEHNLHYIITNKLKHNLKEQMQ